MNEFLIFPEALKSYSKQQIFSSKKIDYLIVICRTESLKASIAKNAFWFGVIATFSGKTSEPLCGKTTKIQENFFYVTQLKTFPYTNNKLSFAFDFTEKWHECPGLGLIAYKTNAYNLFKFMWTRVLLWNRGLIMRTITRSEGQAKAFDEFVDFIFFLIACSM